MTEDADLVQFELTTGYLTAAPALNWTDFIEKMFLFLQYMNIFLLI